MGLGMGFNMRRLLLLTAIAITLPLLLFTFVGCMKKPDNQTNYGPEISLQKIQESIGNETPLDFRSIKKGQYISLDETQTVDIQAPLTYYQRADEVTDLIKENSKDNKEIYTFGIFSVKTQELVDGTWKDSLLSNLGVGLYADPISPTPMAITTNTRKKEAARTEYGLSILSLQKLDATSEKRRTYHNLSRETGSMPIPPAVANQPDCGGLPEMVCRNGLRYLKIKFDIVDWDSETHGIKTAVTYIYSSDIPTYVSSWDNLNPQDPNAIYFTNQLKGCAQTWIELPNGTSKQTVPVMRCSEIRDFQFGHD